MNDIVQHLRSLLLVAIAIALMTLFVPNAEAGVRVRVRVNNRGGVRASANGNANVQVNVANASVNVNGFRHHNARVNSFRVNGFHNPNVILLSDPRAVFVTPQYLVPVNVNGFGVSGFSTFDIQGGCCRH
jgi:hypothetical protein